jgi:hypothetical protein
MRKDFHEIYTSPMASLVLPEKTEPATSFPNSTGIPFALTSSIGGGFFVGVDWISDCPRKERHACTSR